MPSKFTCADCGRPVTSQHAPAKASTRCHPCRRRKRVGPCAYCGNTFVWPDSHPRKYCSKTCLSQSMQIRPPDDIRVRRIHREQAAPGLNPGQRYKLRDKLIAEGHRCAYCQAPADTIEIRQPKAKPVRIEHPCGICGEPTLRPKYCGEDCAAESFRRYMRDRYRAEHGLPVDPTKPSTPRNTRLFQRMK